MNDRDWAIVVGIKNYFDQKFNTLEGPENDAREFYKWVTSPAGGGVPEGQHVLIIPKTPFAGPDSANPTAAMISAAFDHFDTLNKINQDNGKRIPVGRRLWAFFAGHGVTLTVPAPTRDITAVLTADVSPATIHLAHVMGTVLTDYCARAGYFEEIFLLMDCCRMITPVSGLTVTDKRVVRGREEARTFYAFGASVGREAREWAPDGKTYRGVFSMTLLEGLNGAAVDTEESKPIITAESLHKFINNRFKDFIVPEDRAKADKYAPAIQYDFKPPKVVIGPVSGGSATKYPVRLVAQSPGAAGAPFTILRKSKKVAQGTIDGNPIQLETGLHVIQVPAAAYEDAYDVKALKETQDVLV